MKFLLNRIYNHQVGKNVDGAPSDNLEIDVARDGFVPGPRVTSFQDVGHGLAESLGAMVKLVCNVSGTICALCFDCALERRLRYF